MVLVSLGRAKIYLCLSALHSPRLWHHYSPHEKSNQRLRNKRSELWLFFFSFSVFYFWNLWFQITQNSFYNLTKPTVSTVQNVLLGGGEGEDAAAHNQCEKKFMTLLFELPQSNTIQHPGKPRTNWENCYKLWPEQCRIWHLVGENNRTHFVACCPSALCFLNFFNCLRFTFVAFTSDDAMLYDGEERWKNRQYPNVNLQCDGSVLPL